MCPESDPAALDITGRHVTGCHVRGCNVTGCHVRGCNPRRSSVPRSHLVGPKALRRLRFGGLILAAWACSPTVEQGGGAGDPRVAPGPPVTIPNDAAPVKPPSNDLIDTDPSNQGSGFIDEMSTVAAPPPLVRRGLLEKQVSCADGGHTTVSGTVYIPSGELALYNAMVYVPDAQLQPLTPGASCGCEISGAPIASTLTDANGHFVLEDVPVGADIPLVIQVGDWRREFNVGTVEPCVDKPIPDQTLRLPSRQSEGDLPKIAVATGGQDALECLVRKLGVAEEEFTHPRGGGRVQLFAGHSGAERFSDSLNGGQPFPPVGALWSDLPSLQAYDVVLLSCDGRQPDKGGAEDKDERSLQAMFDYANLGGRVFGSHYQEVWFQLGPAPFPDLATYTKPQDLDELSAQIVTDFPKGEAMAQWAVAMGASLTPGAVAIRGAEHTIASENPAYAQRWLASEDPSTVQYLSANTPLGVAEEEQCGRIVLSDIHVSPGSYPTEAEPDVPFDDFSTTNTGFPDGCVTTTLSPQEKLLAFMLFDISACIVPDRQAPTAPPIIR